MQLLPAAVFTEGIPVIIRTSLSNITKQSVGQAFTKREKASLKNFFQLSSVFYFCSPRRSVCATIVTVVIVTRKTKRFVTKRRARSGYLCKRECI